MTNKEIMQEYINGNRRYNAANHLGYTDGTLWNYSTVICEIDRENKTAKFNDRYYSRTTSKIQGQLGFLLSIAGYTIEKYEGYAVANYWGNGLIGALSLRPKEFKPAN